MLSDLTRLGMEWRQKELKQKIQQQTTLPENVHWALTFQSQHNSTGKEFGQTLLTLYFQNILSSRPFFLDLRQERFFVHGGKTFWNPSSFWGTFTDEFRHGVSQLYQGFYYDKSDLFKKGLVQVGLLNEQWPEEDQQKIMTLFINHFGANKNAPMKFNLDTFQASFKEIFLFLMKKKVKLSTDFLFLGVTLVTLYLHLESLGDSYDVKASFIRAFEEQNLKN